MYDLGLPESVFTDSARRSSTAHGSRAPPCRPARRAHAAGEEPLPTDLAATSTSVERDILVRALEQPSLQPHGGGAASGLSLRQMRYRMARLATSTSAATTPA